VAVPQRAALKPAVVQAVAPQAVRREGRAAVAEESIPPRQFLYD
jgi:hypothetical protein